MRISSFIQKSLSNSSNFDSNTFYWKVVTIFSSPKYIRFGILSIRSNVSISIEKRVIGKRLRSGGDPNQRMASVSHYMSLLLRLRLTAMKPECDLADRLNCVLTPSLLVMCAVLLTVRQVVNRPLACFLPTEFTERQAEYAEAYCWVEGLYYPPRPRASVPGLKRRLAFPLQSVSSASERYPTADRYDEHYDATPYGNDDMYARIGRVPDDVRARAQYSIPGYQWLPFALFVQAAMFYACHVVWLLLHSLSGVQVRHYRPSARIDFVYSRCLTEELL